MRDRFPLIALLLGVVTLPPHIIEHGLEIVQTPLGQLRPRAQLRHGFWLLIRTGFCPETVTVHFEIASEFSAIDRPRAILATRCRQFSARDLLGDCVNVEVERVED